jgi:hypothetical protein
VETDPQLPAVQPRCARKVTDSLAAGRAYTRPPRTGCALLGALRLFARSLSRVALSCQDDRPLYTERPLTDAVIDSLAASDVRAYLLSYGLQTSGTLVDVRRRLAVYVQQQHAIAASFRSEVPFNMPFNVRDALQNAPDTVTSLAVGKGYRNAGNTCYLASALHFLSPVFLSCVLNDAERDAHPLVASAVELVTNAAHGVSCTLLDMWNCLIALVSLQFNTAATHAMHSIDHRLSPIQNARVRSAARQLRHASSRSHPNSFTRKQTYACASTTYFLTLSELPSLSVCWALSDRSH